MTAIHRVMPMSNTAEPGTTFCAIESAVSVLANTMRLCVEAHMNFSNLSKIDREEAINNLDRAFEAKLEAFHRLYDVSKSRLSYFDHADTALIIAVRNAIHHRDHPLFQSFHAQLYLQDRPSRWLGAAFLIARHPTLHGAPILMTHLVRLDDLDARLDPGRASPYRDLQGAVDRRQERFSLIDRDLNLPAIRQHARSERYPENQVYLDLMPVFVSATSRVFMALRAQNVAFKGFDADTYLEPFTSEIEVDLLHPTFDVVRILA